jgi:hypothetical protein
MSDVELLKSYKDLCHYECLIKYLEFVRSLYRKEDFYDLSLEEKREKILDYDDAINHLLKTRDNLSDEIDGMMKQF